MSKYSLLLYSSFCDVTFPTQLHVKNVKITRLEYQFKNQNQKLLAVQLSNPFNSNSFIDGLNNYNYTAIFSNLNQNTNLLNYCNQTNFYDVKNVYGTYITTLNIKILIDGVQAGTDSIGLDNPIFIELLLDDLN